MGSMYLKYGSHSHAAGEVELQVIKDGLYTDADTIYAHIVRWNLSGMLVADDAAEMDTLIEELSDAYASGNKDAKLIIVDDAGAETDSSISLLTASTNGGVRVRGGPSFPQGRNAAYVTHLPYTITLEAEVPVSDPVTTFRTFEETITRSGGGPRFGTLETKTGRPVRQQLRRSTIYHTRQFGRAVGIYGRPVPPAAIWPAWQIERPEIVRAHPRRRGSGYFDYETTWNYTFESPVSLTGGPNIWGVTYGS